MIKIEGSNIYLKGVEEEDPQLKNRVVEINNFIETKTGQLIEDNLVLIMLTELPQDNLLEKVK